MFFQISVKLFLHSCFLANLFNTECFGTQHQTRFVYKPMLDYNFFLSLNTNLYVLSLSLKQYSNSASHF